MRSFAKITTLLLIAPLAACSAASRISEIGQAPKLAAVGNPAGSHIPYQASATRSTPLSFIVGTSGDA